MKQVGPTLRFLIFIYLWTWKATISRFNKKLPYQHFHCYYIPLYLLFSLLLQLALFRKILFSLSYIRPTIFIIFNNSKALFLLIHTHAHKNTHTQIHYKSKKHFWEYKQALTKCYDFATVRGILGLFGGQYTKFGHMHFWHPKLK